MKRKHVYDEYSPLMGDHMRTEEETELWNSFEDPPIKIESGSMVESKWIDFFVKVFKLLAYVVTFALVLGTATISKGTVLFMTSQISPGQTKPFCNKKLNIHQQFVVTLPREERVAWMWVLMFTFFTAELLTFIRSLRICLFKTWKMPSIFEFISLFITESLPTIGSALLVFCILPELDVVKGAMLTNAICFVPAVVGFFSRKPSVDALQMGLDAASILSQVTAFVVWPMIENKPVMWLIPVSVILISFGWWENFVSEDSPVRFIKELGKAKKKFENGRYFAYMILSVWKCLLFFTSVVIIIRINEGRVDFLFRELSLAFKEHFISITEVKPVIGETSSFDVGNVIETAGTTLLASSYLTPIWVFLINILATYSCYAIGKFACRILIQSFGYAFPVNLAMPFTISLLIAMCGVYNGNECRYADHIPPYLFFNSPPVYFLHDFIANQHTWIWLLWLLSQTWVTIHIWTQNNEALAKTEKIFYRPMYEPFLIDQSLALNRRREKLNEEEDDKENIKNKDVENESQPNKIDNKDPNNKAEITRIYACGTMWHETREEMMEFLKSIMRLDEDQCARRIVREQLEFDMDDYYELESHVLFDDAFTRVDKNDNNPQINEYVQELALAMDKAAAEVHEQENIRIRPPVKYETPYGGRLVWTLPGKTKLVAHLKDKKKIRPKKRWSQVMYMYYLLGHKLMEREDISPKQKLNISRNTYILALDGDIDFQPNAVHLLVALMRKNRGLGAACGRIHPLGSGPMVWYQMFEYAVGHWLQKATEHMIGCVLCSPGCFSLFRASALMDYNVMKKYTTRSKEARDFVQYDQGEDRWLCTLLLQRGYRVEYSAASDAYTHCPEGFNEFYNQRRRWMPSTTANILDVLMNYKRTVKINDSISRLYILYQIVLMIGTILGPGTIFLMLVGAFVAAFQLDQWSSFLWNVIPILFFMAICMLFKSEVQLFFAGLISAIYGLVMMAVLVGVMLQISNDGPLAPSSLFFFCIAGEMIITALLHPKEVGCLIYGIVYYVTVPSMYMLLVIYSVFNLNIISWGTRDVTIVPKKVEESKEALERKKQEEGKQKSGNRIFSFFGDPKKKDNSGTFEFSIAGLFSCMCCTHKKPKEEQLQLLQISQSLKLLQDKLDNLEKNVNNPPEYEVNVMQPNKTTYLKGPKGIEVNPDQPMSDSRSVKSDDTEPCWLDDDSLGYGEVQQISTPETHFWEGLLDKYLHPIEDDKSVEKDLKDLRDKAVMAFFMINALFVLVVFLLTLKKDLLHVNWPFGVKINFTYLDDVREIQIEKAYLELEPIGFVFLIFFATLLLVQFIAMLFHRFGTFSQILATTYINWNACSKLDKKNITKEQILENDPVKVVKYYMSFREDDDNEKVKEVRPEKRKTVMNLATGGQRKQTVHDLEQAFERRLTKCLKTEGALDATGRKSMAAIVHQKRITVFQKRASIAPFAIPRANINPYHEGYNNPAYDHEDE